MNLETQPHLQQSSGWPQSGRVILAQHDESSVVVYQAFRAEIGRFATEHGFLGGPLSLTRMSWIKPNFLWMMYRSGWGTKENQESVLAVRLKREAFDTILSRAVSSSFDPTTHTSLQQWKARVAASEVRLQWDPDHAPNGDPLARRAVQLGLRRPTLASYAREWVLEIEEVSAFVADQRRYATPDLYASLITPKETVYEVRDPATAKLLGLSPTEP